MTKRRRYHQVTDGDRIRPRMRGHREMCCHCSQVHKVDYWVVDAEGGVIRGGRVEYRAVQDKRATASARRWFKFEREPE